MKIAAMKRVQSWLIATSLLATAACQGESNDKREDTTGYATSLTQISGLASEADCPNGGITLDHGIDEDRDGELTEDEITKSYVGCHGTDGINGCFRSK